MKRAEEIAELERRIDDLDLQTALHSSSGLRRETQARFDSGQESSHRRRDEAAHERQTVRRQESTPQGVADARQGFTCIPASSRRISSTDRDSDFLPSTLRPSRNLLKCVPGQLALTASGPSHAKERDHGTQEVSFVAGPHVARLGGEIHHPPVGKVRRVSRGLPKGVRPQEARNERRRSEMDSSSGMRRRSGWTWKAWVGIALAIAVVVTLVVLIAANAGGGSGGLY